MPPIRLECNICTSSQPCSYPTGPSSSDGDGLIIRPRNRTGREEADDYPLCHASFTDRRAPSEATITGVSNGNTLPAGHRHPTIRSFAIHT